MNAAALNAGDRLEPRQQLLEETPPRFGGRVVRRRQLHAHARQTVDREPGSVGIERDEAAQHQSGAAQQHDGQRQLADDQHVAEAAGAAAADAAARAFLQRVGWLSRDTCSAGARPNRTPVATQIAATYNSTR